MSIKIPKTISAAVLYKTCSKLKVVNDLLLPELKKGQVLVKMFYSGLCHSQLMEINGERNQDHLIPHLLGHEGSGKVIKIGKGVKKVKENDRVVLSWIKSKGLETGGMKFQRKSGDLINAGPITTFSNYTIVSENRVVLMPKKITNKISVLYGCAIPTGSGTILNEIKLKKNSKVGIIGLGGVGMSALLMASVFKPKILLAIDIEENKLKLAKKYGATEIINPKQNNVENRVNKITNHNGLDFVIDAAGTTKTIELGFQIIKKFGGELIFASHPSNGKLISINPHDLICGKKINGTWGGNCNMDIDIQKIEKIFRKNKISLNSFVKKVYSLNDINKAVDDLKNRKVLRAIIKF